MTSKEKYLEMKFIDILERVQDLQQKGEFHEEITTNNESIIGVTQFDNNIKIIRMGKVPQIVDDDIVFYAEIALVHENLYILTLTEKGCNSVPKPRYDDANDLNYINIINDLEYLDTLLLGVKLKNI